jgi:RNA polymerase sigma-70 factor (ECF subfamily)
MGIRDTLTPLRPVPSRPATERTDAELVAALEANLPWARREIWDRYSGHVTRYLSRALGRPAYDVEDLTQEVFLRLFTRRGGIEKPEALREFTMAIAVRVLKWNLRARWVRRKVRLSSTGDLPESAGDRNEDEETRDALRRCRSILDRLNPRECVAFTLRFMEQMTMEEVAATMDVSLSTAKRLVNRAAATVAESVGQDEDLRRYFSERSGGGR